VFSRAIPLIDESDAVSEWIGAASDITARHQDREALLRQQRELEAADQQKNEFLAMLAHELRNPLAPIRNSGEVLARTLARDPIALGAVHTIERQVTHLTRLVDDLLDVSRITQGRIELRRQHANVADLVSRALETVGPLAQRKQQRVIANPASAPMTVNVDPERIVQCLANVLTNANKFTEFGGEIRVETGMDGGFARITVSDDGVGIAPDLLPRVFDLFVQGTRTLDRSQGGLGIGLSIVRRLVEMHGGDVAVESAGEGMGTRVTIRLPLAETAGATVDSTAVPKAKPRRILVVDDNEDAANSLAMVLAIDGHETATAFNGLQALERTRAFKPDVVLLDIGLPGIDGYEVAHRIQASGAGRTMRLVALTGYGQEEDREKARLAGFADHLVKPVEYATLQRAIAEMGAAPFS
jgi:signal transduction histidine kinase/ActR/RegA family two-component response regulator